MQSLIQHVEYVVDRASVFSYHCPVQAGMYESKFGLMLQTEASLSDQLSESLNHLSVGLQTRQN